MPLRILTTKDSLWCWLPKPKYEGSSEFIEENDLRFKLGIPETNPDTLTHTPLIAQWVCEHQMKKHSVTPWIPPSVKIKKFSRMRLWHNFGCRQQSQSTGMNSSSEQLLHLYLVFVTPPPIWNIHQKDVTWQRTTCDTSLAQSFILR